MTQLEHVAIILFRGGAIQGNKGAKAEEYLSHVLQCCKCKTTTIIIINTSSSSTTTSSSTDHHHHHQLHHRHDDDDLAPV